MKCPSCGARLGVACTSSSADYAIRYRKCPKCQSNYKTVEGFAAKESKK